VAVGLSLLVSVTVISTATARLLKGRRRRPAAGVDGVTPVRGGLLAPVDGLAQAFVAGVTRMLDRLQGGRGRQVVVLLAFVGAAVWGTLAMFPKVEYLPNGNRNLVFGILKPPPGYHLDELMAMGQRIEDTLQPYWDVDPGSPEAAELDGPIISDFFYVARGRSVFLGLKAQDPMRASELVPLVQRGISGIPGTFAFASQSSLFEQGLTAGRTIDVEITGPELEVLVELGLKTFMGVRRVLPTAQAIPQPSLDLSNPEVHVVPKWDRAADMQVSASGLGYTVDALVDGAYATDYFIGGDKIDLTIVGREDYASRTDLLEQLPVATPTGHLVPLGALAEIRLASGPEQINHRERGRAITIQVSPPRDMALEEAMERIESDIVAPMLESGELGPGYRVALAGTADKLRATWDAMRFNLTLALLITYLLMAALFESWLYPLVILLSVPLGAVGGFAGLRLLNVFTLQPLDVLTMLGFVMLLGTVVNNAILIVHRALQLIRTEGLDLDSAVLESVRTRVRPIFMTTTTTVCGLLPLVVSPGAGSELYRGIGSVLLGGLVVSTLFTLVLVPTLFHLVLRVRLALGRDA
jgi:HAE1 family hydrophobic/amphiphilic exporter-1